MVGAFSLHVLKSSFRDIWCLAVSEDRRSGLVRDQVRKIDSSFIAGELRKNPDNGRK